MSSYFTVSNVDGLFDTFADALKAWIDAGMPKQRGDSVWISEMKNVCGVSLTVGTTTIVAA